MLPVSASPILEEEYTGTVNGIVNPQGALLGVKIGDTWVSTFYFDLNKGQSFSTSDTFAVFGGTVFGPGGPESPLISAFVTIGGITVFEGGSYAAAARAFNFSGSSAENAQIFATSTSTTDSTLTAGPGIIPLSLTPGFFTGTGSGQLAVDAEDITANLTSVTLRFVPEPMTLSFFGAGIGGLAFLRRNRKKAA
jgi:hypothetical protein